MDPDSERCMKIIRMYNIVSAQLSSPCVSALLCSARRCPFLCLPRPSFLRFGMPLACPLAGPRACTLALERRINAERKRSEKSNGVGIQKMRRLKLGRALGRCGIALVTGFAKITCTGPEWQRVGARLPRLGRRRRIISSISASWRLPAPSQPRLGVSSSSNQSTRPPGRC